MDVVDVFPTNSDGDSPIAAFIGDHIDFHAHCWKLSVALSEYIQ